MDRVSRRRFLATTLTAASAARVVGANDRIRLGVVGLGTRGSQLVEEANRAGGTEWVAVADAWDQRREQIKQTTGEGIDLYADYRYLLERSDIDAVIVATWDHTHAIIAADACRAGKDIYLEKPMTFQPEQGPSLVRAIRDTGRIVQVGVQQRSTPHFQEAKRIFFDSGLIGEVHMVRAIWNNNEWFLKTAPPGLEEKPAGLDWDLCFASQPAIPWDAKRFFNRFAYFDLCAGLAGGLFVHQVDVIQWYLGVTKPAVALAAGGIYQYDDGRETPDNLNLILQYPEKISVTFEASLTDVVPRETQDIVFIGTGGRLHIFRYGYRFIPAGSRDALDEIRAEGTRDEHMKNWLDSILGRAEPNATVEQGHYSAAACHMGNIAYLQSNSVTWRPEWDL